MQCSTNMLKRLLLLSLLRSSSSFLQKPHRRLPTHLTSFFKNLLDQAFANDDNLQSDDGRKGQLDDANDEDSYYQASNSKRKLTETQEKWRAMTTQVPLEGKILNADLFLSGVSNKDPSNDLYGSKVNISTRDSKTGLSVPSLPTLSMAIVFESNNKLSVASNSSFLEKAKQGDWKLSDDGKSIRFRFSCTGYTRTVETKGTIQAVFWSEEENKVSKTSTIYRIPEGWLYGEASLTNDARGRILVDNGVLKIEQTAGLLGAGAKLVPCGLFTAKIAVEDQKRE